jgi:hypothetical protein
MTDRDKLNRIYVKEKDMKKFKIHCINFNLNQEEMFEKILKEWEDE